MKHRRLIPLLVVTALVPLSQVQARDFDGHHGHGHGHGKKDWHEYRHYDDRRVIVLEPHRHRYYEPAPRYYEPAPHYHGHESYNVMPPGYKTVIAAGVTYFVLNELWYRMHGGVYQQVPAPANNNVTIINQ